MRPAPTSRTTASATSETTKAFRSARVRTPAPPVRAPSFRDSCTSAREPASAGARPETTRGQDGDEEREGENGRAQVNQGEAGQVRGAERDEQRDAPSREEEAHERRPEREEQVLRQKLREDPPASGAEGRADRHLAHARGAPGEEQPRHVGAGDEEHEPHGRRRG